MRSLEEIQTQYALGVLHICAIEIRWSIELTDQHSITNMEGISMYAGIPSNVFSRTERDIIIFLDQQLAKLSQDFKYNILLNYITHKDTIHCKKLITSNIISEHSPSTITMTTVIYSNTAIFRLLRKYKQQIYIYSNLDTVILHNCRKVKQILNPSANMFIL